MQYIKKIYIHKLFFRNRLEDKLQQQKVDWNTDSRVTAKANLVWKAPRSVKVHQVNKRKYEGAWHWWQNLKLLNIKRSLLVPKKHNVVKFINQRHYDRAGDSLGDHGVITVYLILLQIHRNKDIYLTKNTTIYARWCVNIHIWFK